MNQRAVVVAILFISSIMLLSMDFRLSSNIDRIGTAEKMNNMSQSSYHQPITISSSEDFVLQGFTGSGTKDDPYTIENLEIDSEVFGISVSEVSEHFSVKNCSFYGEGIGIEFISLQYGVILGCSFYTQSGGVGFTDVGDSSIRNSYFNSSFNPVIITNSMRCNIPNNIIIDQCDWVASIRADNCYGIAITDTQSTSSYCGLEMVDCRGFSLVNITIISDYIGIWVQRSSAVRIEASTITCTEDGIMLLETVNCVIDRVTIEGVQRYAIMISYCENVQVFDTDLRGSLAFIEGSSLNYWTHSFNNVTSAGKKVELLSGVDDTEIDLSDHAQMFVVDCNNVIFNTKQNQALLGLSFVSSRACKLLDINMTSLCSCELKISYCYNFELDNLAIDGEGESSVEIFCSTEINVSNFSFNHVALTIEASFDCAFTSGLCNSSDRGIAVMSCTRCSFKDCQVASRFGGSIILSESWESEIVSCELSSYLEITGSYFFNHFDHRIEDVTVDNRKLGFFNSADSFELDLVEYGQLILFECSNVSIEGFKQAGLIGLSIIRCENIHGSGFSFYGDGRLGMLIDTSENITLRNIRSMGEGPFFLYNSDFILIDALDATLISFLVIGGDRINVRNCHFTDCSISINSCSNLTFDGNFILSLNMFTFFSEIKGISITNCTVTNQLGGGISGWYLVGGEISNNTISSSGHGIFLNSGSNLTLLRNSIRGSYVGCQLVFLHNSSIEGNQVSDCGFGGFRCTQCSNSTLRSNIVQNVSGDAVYLEVCSTFEVSLNYIKDNSGFGIALYGTSNSLVWGNFLSDNSGGNAIGAGILNQWSSAQGVGNYWSDLGNATTMDFDGGLDSIDYHPIKLVQNKTSLPTVNHIDDIQLELGTSNRSIDWIVWTDDEIAIEIRHNGELILSTKERLPVHLHIVLPHDLLGHNAYEIRLYREDILLVQDVVLVNIIASYAVVTTLTVTASIISFLALTEYLRRRERISDTLEESLKLTLTLRDQSSMSIP